MKVSYSWLNRTYFKNNLPAVGKVVDLLTMHSFEVESVEKLNTDFILNINILPNRAHDALSMRGIAKEIGRLTGNFPTIPTFSPKTRGNFKTSDQINLNVDGSNLTTRAVKRLVKGIVVKESPEWLKSYLATSGQKSINNIVDAANFVMLETGQPVHTFDFDAIAGQGKKNINIRGAAEGEKIICLDDKEYQLPVGAIVIADDEKALDIAGIKGGKSSGITANTKNILLSACNFDPVQIRKTSRTLNLRTDASVRFENGITPEFASEAIALLAALIEELAGGEVSVDIVDFYPRQENQYKIGFSLDKVKNILGLNLNEREIAKILERIGFSWKIVKPQEEIKRLAGTFIGAPYKFGASRQYDAPKAFDCSSFVSYVMLSSGINIPRISIDQYLWGKPVSKNAIATGDLLFFNSKSDNSRYESVEYMPGTAVEEGIDHVGLYLGDDLIAHASSKFGKVVAEPFSKSSIKPIFVGARRMIPDKKKRYIVAVPADRLDLRIAEDVIEEIARIYGYSKLKPVRLAKTRSKLNKNKKLFYENLIRKSLNKDGFSEVMTYSFVDSDTGGVEIANPIASDKAFLRKNLRSGIEQAIDKNVRNLDLLSLDAIKIFEIGTIFGDLNQEQTNLAIGLYDSAKKPQDEIKRILNLTSREIGIDLFSRGRLVADVFECNLSAIIEKLPTPKLKFRTKIKHKKVEYQTFSTYPYIVRDVAVFVPLKIKPLFVLELIKSASSELAKNFRLFDIFEKTFKDGSKKISYAFRIVFQADDRTLTDKEVNEKMLKVIDVLKKQKGFMVR